MVGPSAQAGHVNTKVRVTNPAWVRIETDLAACAQAAAQDKAAALSIAATKTAIDQSGLNFD